MFKIKKNKIEITFTTLKEIYREVENNKHHYEKTILDRIMDNVKYEEEKQKEQKGVSK